MRYIEYGEMIRFESTLIRASKTAAYPEEGWGAQSPSLQVYGNWRSQSRMTKDKQSYGKKWKPSSVWRIL